MSEVLRPIDAIKVVCSDDLNDGLDAYRAKPSVAIRGPRLKARFRKGATGHPVRVEWYHCDMHFEPENELSHGFESHSEGLTRINYASSGPSTRFLPMSRAEVRRDYLTPADHRRPTVDSMEQLEKRAYTKWLRNRTKLFHDWERRCARIDLKLERQYQRRLKAYRSQRSKLQQRIDGLDLQAAKLDQQLLAERDPARRAAYHRKLDRLKGTIGHLQARLRAMKAPGLPEPQYPQPPDQATYVARWCDLWSHRAAGQPSRYNLDRTEGRPTDLPCDHGLFQAPATGGYVRVGGSFVGGRQYTDGSIADGRKESFLYDLPLPKRTLTLLDYGPVTYDQETVRAGLLRLLRTPPPQFSTIVSVVELSEIASLIGQLGAFYTTLRDSAIATGDGLMKAYRTGRTAGKIPAVAHLVSGRGVSDAAKWLSSQDLMNKFGLSDLDYFKNVYDALNAQLESVLKPLFDALRDTKRPQIFHIRCGDSVEDSDLSMTLDEYLWNALSQFDPDWRKPKESSAPWDLLSNPLMSLGELSGAQVRIRVRRKIKKVLAVRVVTRLEDAWGQSVEQDEAVARYLLDVMGINFDPKYIWDLTPLSFLIDWVYNVGALLSDIGRLPNLSFRRRIVGAVLTEKIVETHTPVVHFDRDRDSGRDEMDPPEPDMFRAYEWSIKGQIVGGSYTVKRFRRRIVSPDELLGLVGIRFSDYFTKACAFQFITGAELLAQAIL